MDFSSLLDSVVNRICSERMHSLWPDLPAPDVFYRAVSQLLYCRSRADCESVYTGYIRAKHLDQCALLLIMTVAGSCNGSHFAPAS